MEAYKGIKRENSREVFYWLDNYCQNKDPKILENDIVLQTMVKSFYLKRRLVVFSYNIAIWGCIVAVAYLLTKG